MAKAVDPEKLVSLPKLAKEFGYSHTQIKRLVAEKRIEAWLVAGTWLTTREKFRKYVKTKRKPGRPLQSKK